MKKTEIFVANLSERTTEEDLKAFFEPHTKVLSAEIICDKLTKRSKCRGFVEVSSVEEAYTAISALSNAQLDGRSIILTVALDREFYNY